jgi:stress-induced morphogen
MSKEPLMAEKKLKQKIHDVLRKAYFKDQNDLIDVSDGEGGNGNLHLVVVSRKFDGRHMKEKNDLIWDILVRHLKPEEWGKVILTVGASPEEVKAI